MAQFPAVGGDPELPEEGDGFEPSADDSPLVGRTAGPPSDNGPSDNGPSDNGPFDASRSDGSDLNSDQFNHSALHDGSVDETPIDGIVLDGLDGQWGDSDDWDGDDDEDDDSPITGPVRDPADRVWRHPSEIMRAAAEASANPPDDPTTELGGRPGPRRAVAASSSFGPADDATRPLVGDGRSPGGAAGGPAEGFGLRRIIGRFDGPTGPLPAHKPAGSRSGARALVSLAAMFAVGALVTATVIGLMGQNRPAARTLEATPTSTVVTPRLTPQTAAEGIRPSLVQVSSSAAPGVRSSGVVYLSSGEIVTSARLVQRGGKLSVTLLDGSQVPATVVGYDRDTDVAVVRAAQSRLEAARVVSSSMLRPGSPAVTVGLDDGGRDVTVTSGVVAGLRRTMAIANGDDLIGLIQVDRAVDPACGGGALVGPAGDVVGVLVGGDDLLPWGYAVPGEVVIQVADQLIEKGRAEWAWMGIDGANSTNPGGVTVRRVRQAGTEKAQLNIDDVITRVDGMPVGNVEQLSLLLRSYRPGNQVDVTVHRRGVTAPVDLRLTLLTRPS